MIRAVASIDKPDLYSRFSDIDITRIRHSVYTYIGDMRSFLRYDLCRTEDGVLDMGVEEGKNWQIRLELGRLGALIGRCLVDGKSSETPFG